MLHYACVGRSALKEVKTLDCDVGLGLLLTEDALTLAMIQGNVYQPL
jgi:hypothetical protein